jgi:hypothetical protein
MPPPIADHGIGNGAMRDWKRMSARPSFQFWQVSHSVGRSGESL